MPAGGNNTAPPSTFSIEAVPAPVIGAISGAGGLLLLAAACICSRQMRPGGGDGGRVSCETMLDDSVGAADEDPAQSEIEKRAAVVARLFWDNLDDAREVGRKGSGSRGARAALSNVIIVV